MIDNISRASLNSDTFSVPFQSNYSKTRKGARVVESAGLENRNSLRAIEGSNPSPSANQLRHPLHSPSPSQESFMKITERYYAKNRKEWRSWLKKHHDVKSEIWLVYYTKASGKQRIPYNDAVEEALCYGWIDSTLKKIDRDRFAQRFTPRKPKAVWSAMNLERARGLMELGRITKAGLAQLPEEFDSASKMARTERVSMPRDIMRALKQRRGVWKNFLKFPDSYKRIRIGWITAARKRPEVFSQRLRYFVKMTAQNKRYGMVQ